MFQDSKIIDLLALWALLIILNCRARACIKALCAALHHDSILMITALAPRAEIFSYLIELSAIALRSQTFFGNIR